MAQIKNGSIPLGDNYVTVTLKFFMDMEIAMIFRVDYSMPVQNVTAAQERFGTMEEKWDGVKLIGRWHEAGNKGFMVVEAEDAVSLGKYSNQWTDLCDISIVPVMTDEEVGEVLSAS